MKYVKFLLEYVARNADSVVAAQAKAHLDEIEAAAALLRDLCEAHPVAVIDASGNLKIHAPAEPAEAKG